VVVAVSREVQAVVLLVIGVVLARLTLSDAYLGFVKDTLWLPLLASAAVLLALGLLSLFRDQEDDLAEDPDVGGPAPSPARADAPAGVGAPADVLTLDPPRTTDGVDRDDAHGGGHGHDHGRAPRIGILVLVPILALLLIAPEPLGSYAANRGGANRVAAPVLDLPPLAAPVDGAVPMSIGDTVVRALYEPGGPLLDTPVRMIGFVSRDDDRSGYRLSRFSVSCCAADASVRQVFVAGGSDLFEDDTWVEVVARFDGTVVDPDGEGGAVGLPVLELVSERPIERPASPYEY
jgi:uncharacterized repeat protein (TIGR03943 family)